MITDINEKEAARYPQLEKLKIAATAVCGGRIANAISLLTEISSGSRLAEIREMERSYRQMLRFMAQGYDDPGREKFIANIKECLLLIIDDMARDIMTADSPEQYYAEIRLSRLGHDNLESMLQEYIRLRDMATGNAEDTGEPGMLATKRDEALVRIFNYVWTVRFTESPSDAGVVRAAIEDNLSDGLLVTQLIMALWLGLMKWYEPSRMSMLLEVVSNHSNRDAGKEYALKAAVCVMIATLRHADRVDRDVSIKESIESIAYTDDGERLLKNVIAEIIRTFDTKKISEQIKNELLPDIMEMGRKTPDLMKKLGGIDPESFAAEIDANPDWEKMIEESGITDKLHKLSELQMSGGDVMMQAFSNLKNYPFFDKAANWFLPFAVSHSSIESAADAASLLTVVLGIPGLMCDSDKYSFAITAGRLPEIQREMMRSNFEAHAEQLNEQLAERISEQTASEYDLNIIRDTLRNLYRFFSLYKKRSEFANPFDTSFDFRKLPVLQGLLSDHNWLETIGDFYLQREYFGEAAYVLELSAKTEEEAEAMTYEKIGYCRRMLNDFPAAIEAYTRAQLLNPDSKWILRQLAFCYKSIGEYHNAAGLYKELAAAEPEEAKHFVNRGNSLALAGEISAALESYYNAERISGGGPVLFRAIAWCELLQGNYSISRDYYNRVLLSGPIDNDYLNIGHLSLIENDVAQAISFYRHAGTTSPFAADSDVLVKRGVSEELMRLIEEYLSMEQ